MKKIKSINPRNAWIIFMLQLCVVSGIKAQSTQTFIYAGSTVTSDDTEGFTDALTINVPTSAFPANYATTDINIVINYDKTDGDCGSPGTANSFHNEHGFQLQSPTGTQVTIFDPGQFDGGDNISPGVTQTFDDEAAIAIPDGIPANGSYRPNNSFASFDFENPEGNWILRAHETAGGDPLCIKSVDIIVTAEDIPEPGHVSANLALWLKADAGVTGSSVSAWNDQSGNKNHAAQADVDKRPTLTNNAFNFNPTLTFDGTDDMLDVPYNAAINGNNMTVFSVHRLQGDDNTWRSPFTSRNDNGSGQKGYLVYVRSDNDHYDMWTGANGIGGLQWDTFEQALIPKAETQILAVDFTASTNGNGSKNFYLDGTQQGTTSSEYYVANDAQPYRVGAGSSESPTGNYFWLGDIAEQIVYGGVLSTSDREKVESYLAIKYGLTLAHDYYSTAYNGANAGTTTIYDVDNGYAKDIAGIGREDNEGLNQTSSKSENNATILTITGSSSLDDGDYLVWGNDGQTGTTTNDLPTGYDERLNKVWYFDETGETGTVTIRFDLSQLGDRSDDPEDYAVLISNSTTFASATTHTNGGTIASNVLTFTNLNISDGDYITLALSSVGAPGNVSTGMDLWLNGNLVSTEIDGTLDSWSDQSGNQNHGAPATLNRPVVEAANKLNFNSYVNFTNDEVGQVSLGSNANQSTFFAVMRSSTNGSDVFELDANSSPALEIEGGVYRMDGNASLVSSTATGNWNIVGMTHGGAPAKQIFVDGRLEDSEASSLTIAASADYNLFTNFTGEVAEAIHYDNALNTSDRRKLESYLAVKYGITLDLSTQNYLDGAGATILDRTAFASYPNNIAGIGKANADSGDDAQGLNQTQSKSINTTALVTISSATDLDDGEYLLWGADNATALASLTASAPAPAISNVPVVLGRKWKIAETGEVGQVAISFDLSNVPAASGKELASYTLVIDNDEDMSSPISKTKPTSVNANVLTFENIDFADGQYFVLGTGVSAAPGNVSSNIALWLKAGVGVETSTGIPATNGQTVEFWRDQSPNSADASETTNKPTLNTATINGNPVVTFSNQALSLQGSITTTTAGFSFFIVGTHNGGSNSTDAFFEFRNGDDRNWFEDNRYASTGTFASNIQKTTPGMWSIDHPTGSSANIFQNGASFQSSYNTPYSTSPAGTYDYVLGDDDTGGNTLTGNIAELIAYEGVVNATNRNTIESYLAVKYGITLGHNYVATDGSTVIYNTSNGYAFDIAGIGREDNELLAQTQSKSVNTDAILTMGSPTDLDDQEYLIWGNNNGSTFETATGLPSGVNQMLSRKWSVTETGDVQGVQVQFDLTGLTITGTTAADFALIIDGDATFDDGDETIVNASSFDSNIVTFNNVDFSTGSVFSLATSVSNSLTEISSTVGDYEVTSNCPVFDGNSFIDVRDNNNRLVYSINPNGNNLGATCWGVRIRASGSASDDLVNNEDYILDRNFYIEPTTQPSSAVSIRLYVLNDEIDDIRAKLAADGKSSGSNVTEYLQDFLKITKHNGNDLNPLTTEGNVTTLTPTTAAYASTGYSLAFDVTSFSEFVPGTDSNDPNEPLPIDLLYFKATPEANRVALQWSTATEINNSHFSIERSADGKNFHEISQTEGAGNSNQTIVYKSTDPSPISGQSYYRLKQTDFDGTFTYSEIVSVDYIIDNQWVQLSAYPNPVQDNLKLEWNAPVLDDGYHLEVFNVNGSLERVSHRKETNQLMSVDTSGLSRGIYVIRLSIGDRVFIKRVIK